MQKADWFKHFETLFDIRQPWKIMYTLHETVILMISAALSGCETYKEISDFGKVKLDWLRQFGSYENGIPSAQTLSRLMGLIDPKQFEECFIEWMREWQTVSQGRLIAIDGKVLRGSARAGRGLKPLMMVSAYCAENGAMIGQIKADDKSNEIAAIPDLLDILCLSGSLVTIDAAGTNIRIANKIISKGADYLLPVKKNQGRLYRELEKAYPVSELIKEAGKTVDVLESEEMSHGRFEQRQYFVVTKPDCAWEILEEWPSVKCVCLSVTSGRKKGDEPTELTAKYYITSEEMDAERFAFAARMHWSIESGLHWILDAQMNEDRSTIYDRNASENMSIVRRTALHLLKEHEVPKMSIRRKLKMAAIDDEFRARALVGSGVS